MIRKSFLAWTNYQKYDKHIIFRYKTPGEEGIAAITWPADQGDGRLRLDLAAEGHLQWAGDRQEEEGGQYEMESSVYKRIQEESVKNLNPGHNSNGKYF